MKTRDLAYIALFAAITAVLGFVPLIPIGPVPITAQNLGLMLAGSVLGARRGFLSQLLFLVVVAVGVPVLGGSGGLAAIFSPFAGYVLAWPVGALVVGLLVEAWWRRLNVGWAFLANLVGGVLVVDVIGALVFGLVTHLTFWHGAVVGLVVFLPGDTVKAAIAAVIAVQVRRSYPVIERRRRAVVPR